MKMQCHSKESGFHLPSRTSRRGTVLLCLALVLPFMLGACFRQDVLTVDIDIPQMRSAECRRLVLQAIGQLEQDAIERADLDIETGVMTITYDSRRLALKNIEHVIAAAGFDANDERAPDEARAALPEECR